MKSTITHFLKKAAKKAVAFFEKTSVVPEKISILRLWRNALVLGLVAALATSLIYLFVLLPKVRTQVLPQVAQIWPENDALIVSPEGEFSTKSGKPIILKSGDLKFAIIDPTLSDVTIEGFKAYEVPLLVTSNQSFARTENGVRVSDFGETLTKLIEDTNKAKPANESKELVVDRAFIANGFNVLGPTLKMATIAVFLVIFIGLTLIFAIGMLLVSLLLGAVLSLLTHIKGKHVTFKRAYKVTSYLAGVPLVIVVILNLIAGTGFWMMLVLLTAIRLGMWYYFTHYARKTETSTE